MKREINPEVKKQFQKVKSMTNQQFNDQMNEMRIVNVSYGIHLMKEAMKKQKGISDRMINEVLEKAMQVRRDEGLTLFQDLYVEPEEFLFPEELEKLGQTREKEV